MLLYRAPSLDTGHIRKILLLTYNLILCRLHRSVTDPQQSFLHLPCFMWWSTKTDGDRTLWSKRSLLSGASFLLINMGLIVFNSFKIYLCFFA